METKTETKRAVGRPPSCLCGACDTCKHREYMRGYYQDPERRRKNSERQFVVREFACQHCGEAFEKRVKKTTANPRYKFCSRTCKDKAKWSRESYRAADSERRRNQYVERKQAAIASLGGKCVECGATEGLEFDHVDPETKVDTVTTLFFSPDKLRAELAKCQLLCKRCHKAKHSAQ